ncbi:class I SAM-dependent methyltransferase [Salinadaptatus halalkaliphilus]|uniref:Class I SAM-dependent methyltransferase n=1 Tax=Salinadaptatus halalkaliphilus TaxID=2419781 RepID=A0A4S3TJ00_9EURY|nr:class I SAM-dependent methyltransferase [Salinadaptatus halalkaliphilus]THE63946.1 class I SAM-dependent methyltransferase [Salinadaptatus halalkaliphilus]
MVEEGVNKFNKSVENDRGSWAGLGLKPAKTIYATIRKHKPETIIETGVCNGVSTLIILLALSKNEGGELYSIDFPMPADESLPEFRETAYPEGHAFSAIPADKEPGWIVPESLGDRWELVVGKSQRELPKLIRKFDEIDMFIHDLEHSHPCMMFEYELAWEWLRSDGLLLTDDIHFNDSFSIFCNVREPKLYGKMSNSTGYAVKT